MNERLKMLRESLSDINGKKYSQSRFAEEMHITRDILANYEQGRVEMTPLFISSLCEKFNVSEKWLRTGEGEMFLPISKEKELAQIASKIFKEEMPFEVTALIKVLSEMSEEEFAMFTRFVDKYMKKLDEEKENLPE